MARKASLARTARAPALGAVLGTVLGIGLAADRASAQINPVYVDDSPLASEMFRRAQDQTRDNTGEAVRLFQELLDEYAAKLIPVRDAAPDHFIAVRARVLDELRAEPALLERYRLIETAEARRLLDDARLDELARTRSLTEPGLDALLQLAQRALESGHFRSALARLREASTHPDLAGSRAAHCWYMLGAAALFLEEQATYDEAAERLRGLSPAGPGIAQLEQLGASPENAASADGITVLDRARASDLTELVAQEIWSMELPQSLLNRRFQDGSSPRPNPAFDRHRQEADLTTAAVTASEDAVFINQGHTIQAINRLTGRALWSFTDQPQPAIVDRDIDQTGDLNIVAVSGDTLVTLTGHASAGGRSSQGKVICLDAGTGALRWSRTIDGIGGDDDHDGLFPHGAPVIADGAVYVLARKVSRQLLTSCYVVALDLDDGSLRWARHIASSGGVRRSGRSFSTLLKDRGDLYVSTAVGAIARLDPGDASIRWLQRFPVPINPTTGEQERRPWEISAPVVTSRGVLALEPDQRRIVLLDVYNGDIIESHSAVTRDGWSSPRYLLANEHSVYAVGREIRAFSVDALASPLWQLPDPRDQEGIAPAPSITRLPLRGRVQLVEGALIVPTVTGVVVVDDETGAQIHRLTTRTIGNPLAVGSQLLLAGGDRLDAYMSFGRAERLLRERIDETPTDPEPALSMLRLARRVRDLELAMEAADLVLRAIELEPPSPRSRATRQELFEMLLGIGDDRIFRTVDDGEELYAMVGAVAADPEQRVAYHLAYGDWLAGIAFDRAIETYQSILSDPLLAATWRDEDGSVRTAGAWAIDRLAGLIERHGRVAYAPQVDFAAVRLDQLAAGPIDPDRMMMIAREFPFAPAATDAVLLAAEASVEAGDLRSALAALTDALLVAERPEDLRRLTARLVDVCLEAGYEPQAIRLLRFAASREPGALLPSAAGPRTAAGWLRELGAPAMTVAGAMLGEQRGAAELLDGMLVRPHPAAPIDGPVDAFLLADESSLRLIDAQGLADRWSVPGEGETMHVLRLDRRDALLWFGADHNDPRAVMLDAADGSERWVTPPLIDHLDLRMPLGREGQQRMPNGDPFDARQWLPVVGARTLYFIQRSGGLLAFDLERADVSWTTDRTLEQVHLAALHDYGLVLAGLDRLLDADGAAGLVPRLLVLDPRSGRVIHDLRPASRTGLNWMEIDPLGSLVYGMAEGVGVVDLLSGRKRFGIVSYAAMDTQQGWVTAGGMVIKDRLMGLRSIDLRSGTLSEPFDAPVRGEWDPLDLRDVVVADGRIYARYKQRIVRFDPDGAVLGADIVNSERDYKWLLPSSEGLTLVSGQTEQSLVPDRAGRRTQHVYRIYSLSENCMLLGQPLELDPRRQRIDFVELLDGWLLLSSKSETIAVPFPIADAEPAAWPREKSVETGPG